MCTYALYARTNNLLFNRWIDTGERYYTYMYALLMSKEYSARVNKKTKLIIEGAN